MTIVTIATITASLKGGGPKRLCRRHDLYLMSFSENRIGGELFVGEMRASNLEC